MLLCFTISFLFAELSTLSGSLINGRGGFEKCDDVDISLYINSELISTTSTDASGNFVFNLSSSSTHDIAKDFTLDQNYPNPFNSNTSISYSLNEDGLVELSIYDIRGHRISSLLREYHPRGYYHALWDGRNTARELCPQGIYFYVMKFNGRTEIKKMSLINGLGMGISPVLHSPMKLNTYAEDFLVEIEIADKDIENKTLTYNYTNLPSNIQTGPIPVHVYAFLKEDLKQIDAMSGAITHDTLNIYFERPFYMSSSDMDISYTFTKDSLVAVKYENITKASSVFRIIENGQSKKNYGRAYFDILPRLQAWPRQLRRAYVNTNYSKPLLIENFTGNVNISMNGDLPESLNYTAGKFQGTLRESGEHYINFDLVDDSGFLIHDSTKFIISNYNDLDFNDYVLDLLKEYHTDGRYPYDWSGSYTGVTKNLYYKGSKIASANSDSSHVTYCCGITFEIWFRAMKRIQQDMGLGESINGMSTSNIFDFRSKWFVVQDSHKGPSLALESYGVGEEIHKMKDVKKGDFVQLWRTSGSGHSVIFINWTTSAAGDTTGIRYWSTQTSTNGVNYNTEYFDGFGGKIDKSVTHYSRGFKPEEFE